MIGTESIDLVQIHGPKIEEAVCLSGPWFVL
jgi:hypothetical protein